MKTTKEASDRNVATSGAKDGHMRKLTIVIGAGASYDCADSKTAAEINDQYRPPLANANTDSGKTELRARQNVILEFGFFVGKLGRSRAFALVENGVALPSDVHGLIYIPLNDADWRIRLVRELKAAGLDLDANRAFE